MKDGDPAAAAELFEDSEWQAVANYRAGDFADSAAGFAERGDTRSLYNLGNALAKQGEFDSAIDAYEQVLEMDPDDVDAAYNRDLLLEAKQQQEAQQQQGEQQENAEGQGQSDESQGNPDPNQEASADGQTEGNSDENDPSQDPNEEGDQDDLEALQEELQRAAEQQQEQQTEQQLTEAELAELRRMQEQEQAMEQWLRRIPNDPGGLLRRKFRYQYQRMGRDQDGNSLWPDDEAQPW